MPPAGFEQAIPASERPQTHALDRVATYHVGNNKHHSLRCLKHILAIVSPSPVALRPNAGHGLLILVMFLDHTQRHTTVGRTPLDE